MSEGDGVVPSDVDPDYECVPRSEGAAAPPGDDGSGGEPLCPPGYVPRLRRRAPYDLEGKSVVSDQPPEENPETR